MTFKRSSTFFACFYAFFLGQLGLSVPQQPPFQPGPFGVPFAAGNSSLLLATGSARPPMTSGSSSSNTSMCQVENNGLGPVDGGPPNPDIYSVACSCSELFSAHASTWTSTFQDRIGPVTETLTTFTDTSFQPPENCCIKCWISARDVQIIYWPVETSTPTQENNTIGYPRWNATSAQPKSATITAAPTPYTLVQDGFTYVSPSVYVAYHDLQAYAICPSFGCTYPRGRTYNTTIAYMPNQLSTSICTTGSQGIQPVGYGHFAAINFTEYQYSTSAWSQCAKEIEAGSGGSTSIEGPFYSIPHDVSLIDPAWSTCSAVFDGVFDPPRLLDPAPAMVTGQGSGPPDTTPTAAPGHGVLAPAPLLVSSTSSQPPINPIPSSPPASNPASNIYRPNLSFQDDPPAQNDPGNLIPSNDEQTAIESAAGPPISAAPAPPSNPVILHAANPPASITAEGVTVARVPAGADSSDSRSNDPGSPGGVIIAGTTYADGASTALSGPNGMQLSVASDHVLLGGSSYALPPASTPDPVLIAGNPVSRATNGSLVIGTVTINPDAAPTIAYGHAISFDHSSAIIDGSSYALPPASPTQASSPGNSAVTLGNGQVLTAGGAPAIISGTTVALAPDGASLVVNGHSFSIPSPDPSGAPPTLPLLTVGGQTFTAAPSGFTINGKTVEAGAGAITVDGTRVSLGSSGQLVIGSSTTILPSITARPNTPVTVGGQTFLAASAGFTIGSQTVAPGGIPVTIDGTIVSLGPSGKLVIGSQTTTLRSSGGGIEETVGGVVIDALPATKSFFGPTSGSSQGFTGSALRLRFGLPHCLLAVIAGLFMTCG